MPDLEADDVPAGIVAYPDQLDATVRDFRRDLRASLPPDQYPTYNLPAATVEALAAYMAVVAAMKRRIPPGHRCRHVDDPTVRTIIALSEGLVVCARCGTPADLYVIGDDGRCDLCERSTRMFTEHFFSAAATTFHFNACDACARFVARMPATTGRRA